MTATTLSDSEQYERHRALVRETDKKFATVYGAGGAAVLGAGALVLMIAWAVATPSVLLPWMLAITAVLVALFGLRLAVRRRREVFRAQVITYCELNGLDCASLCAYYEAEGIYPYFLSLFSSEPRPRT